MPVPYLPPSVGVYTRMLSLFFIFFSSVHPHLFFKVLFASRLEHTKRQRSVQDGTVTAAVCVALFNQYWGTVTVPGFPRVSRPQIITWCGRILTLHLDYVAGYTGPLLFLFERTHN